MSEARVYLRTEDGKYVGRGGYYAHPLELDQALPFFSKSAASACRNQREKRGTACSIVTFRLVEVTE